MGERCSGSINPESQKDADTLREDNEMQNDTHLFTAEEIGRGAGGAGAGGGRSGGDGGGCGGKERWGGRGGGGGGLGQPQTKTGVQWTIALHGHRAEEVEARRSCVGTTVWRSERVFIFLGGGRSGWVGVGVKYTTWREGGWGVRQGFGHKTWLLMTGADVSDSLGSWKIPILIYQMLNYTKYQKTTLDYIKLQHLLDFFILMVLTKQFSIVFSAKHVCTVLRYMILEI